jgi:CRISPR-associated protein Cmr3
MKIEFKALDTLFFKDGKPFYSGEDVWGNGMFPPAPSVIYGAIRSAWFVQNDVNFDKANSDDDPTKNLKIKSIYFYCDEDNQYYFPCPLDIVESGDVVYSLSLVNNKEFINSSGFSYFPILDSNDKIEKEELKFIGYYDLSEYLVKSKVNEKIRFLKMKDFITPETKTGIARDSSTRTTREGKIYRVEMLRIDKIKFVVDFEGIDLSDKGFLKLGAEGKVVRYESKDNELDLDKKPNQSKNYLKLVLTTPAIFEKGWIPSWFDEDVFEGIFNGIRLKLIACYIGKPIYIGGFDIKKRKPKPMKKAVPSGSVYYFEILSGSFDDCFKAFNFASISDLKSEEGFGISIIGGIEV